MLRGTIVAVEWLPRFEKRPLGITVVGYTGS